MAIRLRSELHPLSAQDGCLTGTITGPTELVESRHRVRADLVCESEGRGRLAPPAVLPNKYAKAFETEEQFEMVEERMREIDFGQEVTS